jgi:predicted flap endonuclease-1-like 5' DNA nuclease
MDRSVRSLLSITLVVAAVFVAMNRIVESARIEEWWPVLVLLALALLVYIWEGRGRATTVEDITEASAETALEGYRRAVTPPAAPAAAVIPTKTRTEAQATYDAIVEAYDEIRDTDVRSDVMASVTTIDTQEAHAVGGRVENIMDSGATGTFEEVDEIAGSPGGSISKDHPRTAQPASTPPETTPEIETEGAKNEYTDTQSRSDLMASAATMDTPEAQEAETGLVENIMETGATGKPEEVDEIAGPPMPSRSKGKAKAKSAPSLQPDDLTVVEGIGMKMAAALKAAGIDTYVKLSASSEEQLRAAVEAAGMRLAPTLPTWAEQAGMASTGDWDGLKAYQKKLKGGRKK